MKAPLPVCYIYIYKHHLLNITSIIKASWGLFTWSEYVCQRYLSECSVPKHTMESVLYVDRQTKISVHKIFFTPVLDFWWRLSWVSKPGWIPCMLSHLCGPRIHLWCDTYWLYKSQHNSWAFLIHVLADMSTSIGGGSGVWTHNHPCGEQRTVYHSPTPAQPHRKFSSNR